MKKPQAEIQRLNKELMGLLQSRDYINNAYNGLKSRYDQLQKQYSMSVNEMAKIVASARDQREELHA